MIFNLHSITKIHLLPKPIDFRKGVIGLSYELCKFNIPNSKSGEIFIFYSKNKKSLKILYHDNLGFELWHKKLINKGEKYKIPNNLANIELLTKCQFTKLLTGYSILEKGFLPSNAKFKIA